MQTERAPKRPYLYASKGQHPRQDLDTHSGGTQKEERPDKHPKRNKAERGQETEPMTCETRTPKGRTETHTAAKCEEEQPGGHPRQNKAESRDKSSLGAIR
jgi:hypothetical protein